MLLLSHVLNILDNKKMGDWMIDRVLAAHAQKGVLGLHSAHDGKTQGRSRKLRSPSACYLIHIRNSLVFIAINCGVHLLCTSLGKYISKMIDRLLEINVV